MIDTELGTVIAVTPAEPRTIACVCDPDGTVTWHAVVAWATTVDDDGELVTTPIGHAEGSTFGRAWPIVTTDNRSACFTGTDRTTVWHYASRWCERQAAEATTPTPKPFVLGESRFA